MSRCSACSAALALVALGFGCSVITPGEEVLSSGRCASDEKLCDSWCVSKASPSAGCGAETCEPCQVAHAAARCAGGACAIAACELGFADCNGAHEDGCEVDLRSDPLHCGKCQTSCNLDRTSSVCVAGQCEVVGCASGYADCDATPKTACETDLASDAQHCGGCGKSCSLPWATQASCVAGACRVAECAPGHADCNSDSADGCETDTIGTDSRCGDCTTSCVAEQLCDSGKCVARCPAIRALHGQARLSVNPVGFGVGAGDFTVELWLAVGPADPHRSAVLSMNEQYQVNGVTLQASGSETTCNVLDPAGIGSDKGSAYVVGPPLALGVWTHVACVRSGSTLTLFVAGKAVSASPIGTKLLELSPLALGIGAGYSGTPGAGTAAVTLGPFRFSNEARYHASFSPKTGWPIDASTVAQFLTTKPFSPNASSALVDEAGGDNLVTNFGGFQAAMAGVACEGG